IPPGDCHLMLVQNYAFDEQILEQLRQVLRHTGRGGGYMTPSVYESAQVLRFYPELVDVDAVIHWLLKMQRPDGGWGEEGAPMYPDVATRAAVHALRRRAHCAHV